MHMRKLKLIVASLALLVGGASISAWAQKDVTSQYITNATLSNGTTGWTNVNFNTPVKGNNTVGYASECYAGWGSLEKTNYSLTQNITLPAGHYTLVNYSFFRYGLNADTDPSKSLAYLKAGENQVAVKTLGSITAAGYANSQAEGANAFDSKMYRNALDFTIDANNTEIEVGLYGTFDLKQSWMICGMFELINNDIPATMDAPFDVTGYITNPGFEYRDMSGWTVSPSGFFGTQNNNQGFKVGGYYAEKWQQSGALPEGSMSQTLTNLPAGFYKLTVNLGGDGTYVHVNGKTANWEADKDYTVGYVLAENEDFVITAGKTAEGTANWIHFDNFRLQFCGDVAAALTTLCGEVTTYESKLSASDYAVLLGAVNGYNKSYSDVDELLAAIDAVQALYDAADLYIEYNAALTAAQAIDQEAPMNSAVLTALQSAIATQVTMQSSAADVVAATNALNTAKANANTSISNYAEAKAILDAADTYDESGKASYAANEAIVALQAAYDDGSLVSVTNEQKSAAAAALVIACKAQVQPLDGCDMTVYIVNPGIDGNVDGWTCERNGNGTMGGPLKPSNDAMEFWGASTLDANAAGKSFDYYQTIIGLPTGAYTISAEMLNSTNGEDGANWNGGGTSGVYAKTASSEVRELVTIDDETFRPYTTDEILVVDGELRIGVKNISALTGRWFAVDNFKLTYVRQLTDDEKEEIAKKEAVARYNDAIDAAATISEGDIPATAYSNLQTVITNNTLADGTSSEYNAAATAINEVAAAVQPLVAPYAVWKTLKAYADALVAVANDNTTANSTLADAISDQTTTVEAATTAAVIETAILALKDDMVTYAGEANPTEGNRFDLTFLMTNPDLTGLTTWKPAAGWASEETDGNSQVMVNDSKTVGDKSYFYEYWSNPAKASGKFALYNAVTLPVGTFSMTCYAFAEDQGYSGSPTVDGVFFYANETQGSCVTSTKLAEQSISFINETVQEVKIGLKTLTGNTRNWMGIGYVNLYKEYTDNTAYAISVPSFSNGSATVTVDDEEAEEAKALKTVTVTVTPAAGYVVTGVAATYNDGEVRTLDVANPSANVYTFQMPAYDVTVTVTTFQPVVNITDAGWATYSSPYALDFSGDFTDRLENVYIVTGANGGYLELESVMGDTVPANTGLLLEGWAYFVGTVNIPVAASSTKDVSANKLVGVTTATEIAAEAGYVLMKENSVVAFYQNENAFTVGANTAYLPADFAGNNAPAAFQFITEVTGISEVNAEAATGEIYNLAGQRVSKAVKGLYIQNGKKILVK